VSVKEASTRLIAGRYRLLEVLGQGGVGQVWRARDELLRRDVAVKEIPFPATVSELDRASMQARVLREARAAAGLPHSSVVTVYDVIRDEAHGYIVMELIEACSISEIVQRDGPMPVAKVAAIASQMVDVLEVAHQHGIIHRDVKPGNVMVLPEGSVKLADFGIAWIKDDPKITASGLVLGSPSFMAPEQAQGMESTAATDMYGLGATMYYAVEGELPFDKGQAIATLSSVMADPPRRPSRAGALAPVIRALMAKEPAARPTAGQVRSLLAPLVGRGPFPPSVDGGDPRGQRTGRAPVVFDDVAPAPAVPAAAAAGAFASRQEGVGAVAASVPAGVPERIHAEMGLGWGQRSGWQSSTVARILGVLLVAALVAGAIYFLSHLGNTGTNTQARQQTANGHQKHHRKGGAGNAQPSPDNTPAGVAVAPTPTASVPAVTTSPSAGSTSSSGVVPAAGWVPYSNSSVGWSIAYPPGWAPQQRDSHDLDFSDPHGGRYLRVAWTTTPGPDPAARWREYSKSFGARYPNYRTISISPNFTFKGWKASAWEYTYSDGGSLLHAVDLALVNGTYGFALNFQTHDSDWVSSQDIFTAFKQSFVPPS
jgi:tRNA A-37 threonylcarbamoyl transferase component Bud32